MGQAEKVQAYRDLSRDYLRAAEASLRSGLHEPAMFSAIHALELALKAALMTRIEGAWKTHNVGGEFGRHFRVEVGEAACRRVNVILAKYNLPRYPREAPVDAEEVGEDIRFIRHFIERDLPALLKEPALKQEFVAKMGKQRNEKAVKVANIKKRYG